MNEVEKNLRQLFYHSLQDSRCEMISLHQLYRLKSHYTHTIKQHICSCELFTCVSTLTVQIAVCYL